MNDSRFIELYEEITFTLNRYEIKDSLHSVIDFFENNDAEAPALASFRTLMSALKQLHSSLQEGLDISLFQDKLDQIYLETWQLLDQIRWEHSEHKPMIFAVDDLVAELEPQHLTTINDNQLECIFSTIRTTYPIGKAQRTALHQAILSDEVPMYLRATLLSAMTLNVLEWFDADLLECMYTYSLDDQPAQLRQQSWAALFLCGMVHDKRIMHHSRLREEYLLLCEMEPTLLEQLQKLLLPLREYKSFSRGVKKLFDTIMQSVEESIEGEKTIEVTKDSEDFKQFVKLMHSNIDTGYSQFRLMSKLGFFAMEGTDHHWLMPFDCGCEVIKKALEETPELKTWYQLLLHNRAQTHTDKYATFLITSSKPDRAKELNQKLSQLSLPQGEMADLGSDQIMQIHLQDLYRFFTLSKTGKTLRNPFELSPDLSAYECFGKAFCSVDNLRMVAEYLFKAEEYTDAAFTYERLLEHEITQQNLKNAIVSMQNSVRHGIHKIRPLVLLCNKLFPGDEEILMQLIYSYGYEEPLMEPYYKEALEYFPDSIPFLKNYGKFLNLAKRYSEALNPLYKAFMLDENDEEIIRELATAQVRLGQIDKARNLLNRLSHPEEEGALLSEILSNN